MTTVASLIAQLKELEKTMTDTPTLGAVIKETIVQDEAAVKALVEQTVTKLRTEENAAVKRGLAAMAKHSAVFAAGVVIGFVLAHIL